jgi:DNA-binding protein H-NS
MSHELDFKTLPIDRLWNLFQDIRGVLTDRLSEQKRDLDDRLRSLSQQEVRPTADALQPKQTRSPSQTVAEKNSTRRAYPKVMPLYRNPAEPSETWSGRGNKPRWLAAQVNAGKSLADFLIKTSASGKGLKRGADPKSKAGK